VQIWGSQPTSYGFDSRSISCESVASDPRAAQSPAERKTSGRNEDDWKKEDQNRSRELKANNEHVMAPNLKQKQTSNQSKPRRDEYATEKAEENQSFLLIQRESHLLRK
jgi:hypothetical protein